MWEKRKQKENETEKEKLVIGELVWEAKLLIKKYRLPKLWDPFSLVSFSFLLLFLVKCSNSLKCKINNNAGNCYMAVICL